VTITGDFAYCDVEFVKLLYPALRNSKLTCSLGDGKINIVFTICMKKGDVLIDKINPIFTAIIEEAI